MTILTQTYVISTPDSQQPLSYEIVGIQHHLTFDETLQQESPLVSLRKFMAKVNFIL